MKGKKRDVEFLSQFISECIQKDISSSEGILQAAELKIQKIDQQLKEISKKKILRSKLLDVVEAFQATKKPLLQKEMQDLLFYQMNYLGLCYDICCKLQTHNNAHLKEILPNEMPNKHLFALKQLLENKIIVRVGEEFIRGEIFDDFYQFLKRNDKL